MGVAVKVSGSFKNTERYLKKVSSGDVFSRLEYLANQGVSALSAATPVDSGKTKSQWGYRIKRSRNKYSIQWTNSNVNDGVPIAIILQYGHGTRTGGYVAGRDYINPAMRPVFDKIANEAWKVVKSA